MDNIVFSPIPDNTKFIVYCEAKHGATFLAPSTTIKEANSKMRQQKESLIPGQQCYRFKINQEKAKTVLGPLEEIAIGKLFAKKPQIKVDPASYQPSSSDHSPKAWACKIGKDYHIGLSLSPKHLLDTMGPIAQTRAIRDISSACQIYDTESSSFRIIMGVINMIPRGPKGVASPMPNLYFPAVSSGDIY